MRYVLMLALITSAAIAQEAPPVAAAPADKTLHSNFGCWNSDAGIGGEAESCVRTRYARVTKAKLADVLIAQSCIDHDVSLITYDADFRHFTRAGLKLA